MDTRRGWSAVALAITLAACAGTAEHAARPTTPVPAAPAFETPKPVAPRPSAPIATVERPDDAAPQPIVERPSVGSIGAAEVDRAPGDEPAATGSPSAVVAQPDASLPAPVPPPVAAGSPAAPAATEREASRPAAFVPRLDSVAGLRDVYERMRDDIRNGDLPRAAERFATVERLLEVSADDPRHEIAGDLELLGGYVRARLAQRRDRDG